MRKKKTQSLASSAGRWFLPGGLVLSLRPDLLPVLRAMDGLTAREIIRSREVEASSTLQTWEAPDLDGDDDESAVAIVSAIGPLTQYPGPCDWLFGATSYEQIMADMEDAAADDSVSAIVLLVDGPGGMVAGMADSSDRIRAISAIKPVVAYSPGDCCSASYGLFCAAPHTVVSQSAMVGSIGTVWTFVDDSKAQDEAGVRDIDFVADVSPDKRPDPTTPEGKALIQKTVNELGDQFVLLVARMRGVSEETVRNDFGRGWILVGADAVQAGLADKVGTLDDAIQLAQELALAASNSTTTGATPTTEARATSGLGGMMAKTVAELEAENADTVAQIRASAAQAERERVSAILKYNTAQYRAFAATQIDAAIADPSITAEKLAAMILNLHSERLAGVAGARGADAGLVPPVGAPAGGPAPAPTTETTTDDEPAAKLPASKDVYASFNKQAGFGCNN